MSSSGGSIKAGEPALLVSTYPAVRKRDGAAFAERYPHPFLVFDAEAQMDAGSAAAYQTTTVTLTTEVARTRGHQAGEIGTKRLAVPVLKSTRNPFEGTIYVGRSTNNDIVIGHSSISKAHAFFHRDGGQWFLTDVDSQNGTRCNGIPLVSQKAVPLQAQSELVIGSVAVTFFLPLAFHEWVNELLAGT